jgi:hypothetical protein
MSETPPSPGSTLGQAVDGVQEAAADASEQSAESTSVTDLLLHTEPDLDPRDVQHRLDVGVAPAHAFIGLRKVLHGATGKAGKSGMPAVGNFGIAGYHGLMGLESNDVATDDQEDGVDLEDVDGLG